MNHDLTFQTFQTLQQIAEARRSIRKYTDRVPDRATIEAIAQLGLLAPNSCNLQTHKFIYVDKPEVMKKLSKTATSKLSWAPACFVFVYDRRYSKKRLANLQGLSASIQNILLGATAHGLGTCWMAGFVNDDKVKKILEIPAHYDIAGLVGIGYPDLTETDARPHRLGVQEVLLYNKFDTGAEDFPHTADVDQWDVEDTIEYRKRIAPIYAPRFHLAPFSFNTSQALLKTLQAALEKNGYSTQFRAVLDAVSYDGLFARDLLQAWNLAEGAVTLSDYFEYPLLNFKSRFPGVHTRLLNEHHSFVDAQSKRYDLLTCVNKLEITPQPEKLLGTLRSVAGDDGLLFVSCTNPWSPLALHKRLKQLHPEANCYEANPLFRSGPFRFRGHRTVTRWLARAGWTILDHGSCISSNRAGGDVRYKSASMLRNVWNHWWLAKA